MPGSTPASDIHEIALRIFIEMLMSDPIRDPKRVAQMAYEAANAFVQKRKEMGG
jgi:hypothetical protein